MARWLLVLIKPFYRVNYENILASASLQYSFYYLAVQEPIYSNSAEVKVYRSSLPEVFLGKDVLKICSKFTSEHPCRSVISIKLRSKFIEITLRDRCWSVNLLHIFRKSFYKNTYRGLLLNFDKLGKGLWWCSDVPLHCRCSLFFSSTLTVKRKSMHTHF